MQPLSKSQTSQAIIRELDLKKIQRLVSALISPSAQFAISSVEKKLLWCGSENIRLALGTLGEDSYYVFRSIEQMNRYDCGSGTILEIPLIPRHEEPVALLYIYEQPDSAHAGLNNEEGVNLVIDAVEREFEYNRRIKQMKQELDARYEELSLAFDTGSTCVKDQGWRSSVTSMLAEYRDMVDFGFSVLLLQRHAYTPQVKHWQRAASEEQAIINALREELLPWMQFHDVTLLANYSGELLQEACPSLPFKLVATPIHDHTDTPIGVLATLNAYHDRDFHSSDKNLNEIMAKRIASVISAQHDTITALLNREGFQYPLHDSLQAARMMGEAHCLLNIDIDNITLLNEMAGYAAGDRLMQHVASVIETEIREDDVAARFGGDVFLCLLHGCSLEAGEQIARRILKQISSAPFIYEDLQLDVSVCIGLTTVTAEAESIQAVLAAAEIARDAAKENGPNHLRIFAQGNVNLLQREQELRWVNRIQTALRENRFTLFAQAIKSLDQSQAPHFEILLRMQDGDGKLLSPAEFMPTAERYQMLPMIDRWVLQNALQRIGERRDAAGISGCIWGINLSAQSLSDDSFQQFLESQLLESGMAPQNICLEIKETSAFDNLRRAQHFIEKLKARGMRVALDDFGKGLASFSHLQHLDVDYVKIHGAIVKPILQDPVAETLIASISQVGKILGIKVVAEFVETSAIENKLIDMGISMLQGYGIARPITLQQTMDSLCSAPNTINETLELPHA